MALLRAAAGLICALLMLAVPPASAQPADTPSPTVGVGGTVFAAARSGNTLFVGGSFGLAGPNAGRLAAVNPTSGTLGRALPAASGPVSDVIPDGTGGYYVAGDFVTFGGLPRSGLAHVLASGAVDPNWNPTSNGPVSTLLLKDGLVYVGGDFGCLGGDGDPTCGEAGELARPNLAAIEPDGDVAAFDPRPNDTVTDLAAAPAGDPSIFVGGRFDCLGGNANSSCGAGEVARFNLARIETDGDVSSWNARVRNFSLGGGSVETLAVGGGSSAGPFVYVGGDFSCAAGEGQGNFSDVDSDCTDAGEEVRPNAAAFALSDSEMSAWSPEPNNDVAEMAISGTQIFLGGRFTVFHFGEATEAARVGLASVPTVGSSGTPINPWDAKLGDASVSALRVNGSNLHVGGGFACVGVNDDTDCTDAGESKRFGAAAFNLTTAATSSWAPNVDGPPRAIAVGTGELAIGGSFTLANVVERGNVAAINLTDGALLPFNPDLNAGVNDLLVDGTSLILGGGFTCVGANSDSDCTDAGETPRSRLARITTAGAVQPWNPAIGGGSVFDLELSGSALYAGGSFTCAGGDGDSTCGEAGEVARSKAAAVSTVSGASLSWNPAPNDDVFALVRSGSTVFAGGDFTCLGGDGDATCGETGEVVRRRLAGLDATSGAPSGFDPGANGIVETLALDGGKLYAGGLFTCVGGDGDATCGEAGETARGRGAAFDPAGTGAPLAWNPAASAEITSLHPSGGRIYAGGTFSCLGGNADATCGEAGETDRRRLAALDPETAAPDAWNPRPNNGVATLAGDGETLFVGGSFAQITDRAQRGIGVFEGVGTPPPPPPPPPPDPGPTPDPDPGPAADPPGNGPPSGVAIAPLGGAGGEPAGTLPEANALLPGACANVQTGSALANTLTGTSAGDRLVALAGNDTLNGGAGDDCLLGGDGNDKLTGAEGRDTLDGGKGKDSLVGGPGDDKLIGGAGDDKLAGGPGKNSYAAGAGKDSISAANKKRETVDCGTGRDKATVDRFDKVKGCESVRRKR